jgi:hypothetical protein
MMTKYNSKKTKFKSSLLDRVYYSFSVEFWLSIVTVGIAADWIFKFGTDSLVITLAWAGILGTYMVFTNRVAGDLWYNFRGIKAPQHLSLLIAGMTVLGSLFLITCMTDPAHALIVTNSGEAKIKALLDGSQLSAAGAPSTAMAGFAAMVVTLIKVFFALAFVFGLYGSYQKYQERAELQDIVQAPVVLIVVVLAIDGILGLIFAGP